MQLSQSALLLIDLQNDFLPGGALAVPRGDEVIPVANRVSRHFEQVVATVDWHPSNHVSFADNHDDAVVGQTIRIGDTEQVVWPRHCIQGSWGATLSAELVVDRIGHQIHKGSDPDVDSYSGFFDNQRRRGTGLHEHLRSRGIGQLFILGLATDYCVLHTVLDALELGYEVLLLRDGCRGVDLQRGDCERAEQRMSQAGAKLITSQTLSPYLNS